MPNTGTNITSSVLSFAMPAVIGMTDHLHEWAHHRLGVSLGPNITPDACNDTAPTSLIQQGPTDGPRPGTLDVRVRAQVTAAVEAALRTSGSETQGKPTTSGAGQCNDNTHQYSKFQLDKLKGFCCMRTVTNLSVIWEYFKSTKDVDAQ